MTHHTDAELLPCPFCGNAATTTGPWEIGTSDRYEACIECLHCGFQISSDAGELFDKVKALRVATEKWNRRAPAAPVPQGWIDPNDKAQKQYLPHIGERVLFKHDGRVYLGKHTGGSFKAEYPFGKTFGTWDCMWMYPSALDAAAPQPPEAGCSVSNGETQAAPVRNPLTDEEISSLAAGPCWAEDGVDIYLFARAIEQAHGIKD